jgi:hypothetical protein
MRIGLSAGPVRIGGTVRTSRRRGSSGCLPWVALAVIIGVPVSAVQSCQAKESAGYNDPGNLASAVKGYAQQKTGTAPASVTCDQDGASVAYTCYADFASKPAVTYDVVTTPDGKSFLVTGDTTAGAASSPPVSSPAGGEAPAATSGGSGSGGVYVPHPHVYVCVGHHVRVCS